MVIKLYKTTSDPKDTNKVLTDELAINNGVARDPVDVVNPVIEYGGNNTTLAGYNYAYIEDYSRFYFMDVQNDSYNLNTLTLHCDVVKTAAPFLKQRMATVSRNEKLYNSYLTDPEFNAYAYKNIVTKQFPSAVNADSIVLMTVG